MQSVPASETIKGPAGAVPELRAFAAELATRPLPVGVRYYVFGDSQRSEADAERYRTADPPTSRARWGESPHHWRPALALDVYPILSDGTVSNAPRDYAQIVDVAEAQGLQSGRTFNDWPHVQIPNWRSRTAAAPAARPGILAALLILAVAGVVAVRDFVTNRTSSA